MRRTLTFIAAAAALAACSPSETTVPDTTEAGTVLSYSDAFVMEPIGGRDMTMGGVTVGVEGGDVRLVAASSPAIGTIELHTMAMVDGKMTMRQVTGFDIADGKKLQLKRGGNHLMMFDVAESVAAGETVDITLTFEDDQGAPMTLVVDAAVRAVGE